MRKLGVITSAIHKILSGIYLQSQISTLVACVLGLITGGELSLTGIGRYLPGQAKAKHKIKRVDRFLANSRIDPAALCHPMLMALSAKGNRSLVVSVDWSKFDDFQGLVFAVTTRYGRAVPVYWKVIDPDEERMKAVELEAIKRFHACVPAGVKVTLLADRGFNDVKFLSVVAKFFPYVVRLKRDNTFGASADTEFTSLEDALGIQDQVKDFGDVLFTAAHFKTRIIGLHARKSVDPWFLATNLQASAQVIVDIYSRRFDIEHAFKDLKDVYRGWQLGSIRVSTPERLERLLMVAAVAFLVMVLLGLLAESRGKHRGLQVNSTRDKRYLSLWRVGVLIYTTARRLPTISARVLLSFLDVLPLQLEVENG